MLGNFFRISTDNKQRINTKQSFIALLNKKQNVEIESPASSGGQGKYTKYFSFPRSPLEAELSIFNVIFF